MYPFPKERINLTLTQFKKLVKTSFVITVLFVYGIAAYSIGKFTSNSTDKVKGVSTNRLKDEIIEKPLPYADVQAAEIIASTVKLCSNTFWGFEIAYPGNWFTTYNTEDQKCSFFAPYSFVLPYFVEDNFTPIELKVLEVGDWLNTVRFYENPNDFYNVFSSQNIEVNGRLVKKIEAVSTGNGNVPKGFKAVHLLVFDGQTPFRLSYNQLDQKEDVEESISILTDMISSLKLF